MAVVKATAAARPYSVRNAAVEEAAVVVRSIAAAPRSNASGAAAEEGASAWNARSGSSARTSASNASR